MAKKQPKFADRKFVSVLQQLLKQFAGNRKALAAELAVHPSTLSRWINAQTVPSVEERVSVAALLLRGGELSIFRLVKVYKLAPPGVQAALRRLIEEGFDVWDDLDPATRNSLCDLFLKINGGENDD